MCTQFLVRICMHALISNNAYTYSFNSEIEARRRVPKWHFIRGRKCTPGVTQFSQEVSVDHAFLFKTAPDRSRHKRRLHSTFSSRTPTRSSIAEVKRSRNANLSFPFITLHGVKWEENMRLPQPHNYVVLDYPANFSHTQSHFWSYCWVVVKRAVVRVPGMRISKCTVEKNWTALAGICKSGASKWMNESDVLSERSASLSLLTTFLFTQWFILSQLFIIPNCGTICVPFLPSFSRSGQGFAFLGPVVPRLLCLTTFPFSPVLIPNFDSREGITENVMTRGMAVTG